MKEFFVAFIIALVAGSICNQMNGIDPGAASAGTGATCGTDNGGGAPIGGGGSAVAGNPQAQAGEGLIVDVDEGMFQGMVLDSREPVLVEFYTNNCPHCTRMAPILGQLAFSGQGVVRVCKIDASKSPAIAERYDISGVPAYVLFSEGHMLDSTSGARTIEDMRAWLRQNNVTVPNSISSNGTQM